MADPTIRQVLGFGATELASVSDKPRLEAERLLLFTLGRTESSWLYTHSQDTLSHAYNDKFNGLVKKRLTSLPLAYITGEQEFYGRTFKVTPDVLIPRPETEDLIEKALVEIKKLFKIKRQPLVLADIGTGSGIIAITLALEAANAIKTILATDMSEAALNIARANIAFYDLNKIVQPRQGNLLKPLRNEMVDLIISNPPYVPTAELDRAKKNPTRDTAGLNFEPRQALDGGPTGDLYVNLIKQSKIPAVLEVTGGKIEIVNY